MTKQEIINWGAIKNHGRYANTCIEYNRTYLAFLKDLNSDDNYKKLLDLREDLKRMSKEVYNLHHG